MRSPEHLNAQAALSRLPQFPDQGACLAVLIPRCHVVGLDEGVRVDELAITANAVQVVPGAANAVAGA
jgi:hypothetical protein